MKRYISLILSLTILLCSFSMFAAGAAPTPVCKVTFPAENDKFICAPLEGYSDYVPAGESYEFYIEAKEGYSVISAIVTIDGRLIFDTDVVNGDVPTQNDIRTFKIDEVVNDVTVNVMMVMEPGLANVFQGFIIFIMKVIAAIQSMFGMGLS